MWDPAAAAAAATELESLRSPPGGNVSQEALAEAAARSQVGRRRLVSLHDMCLIAAKVLRKFYNECI